MSQIELSEYAQKLLDRVVAMTIEIDNLRTAYGIVRDRLNAETQKAWGETRDFTNEAHIVEQFASLSTKAAEITREMTLLTKNEDLIQCANTSLKTAEDLDRLIAKFKQSHLGKK